ncbi:hypothetical protein QF046_002060 [Microbacterium sp. W4I4]|uniref:hypothetical protein n=1 Tax=Microbacterium sp. W4I4 TaxID=3042295 RepID=UPI002780B26B|nr:hypothetical protein [Microbacterium sp. W4I4]MDQ0614419.1 hypothetical protein [Microbacterium sp. W4I4]
MKIVPIKLVGAVTLLALLGGGAVGCSAESDPATPKSDAQGASSGATEEASAPKPVDLAGTWKQTNSNSEDSYQAATVTGDTIEIQWVAPDTKSLYWSGTVEVPQDGSTDFTWDSVNDKTKTAKSVMASGDDTKTFTYKDGELSYELTALGTTMTVRMAKE